jgi:sulfur carrier protein
MQIKINGEIRAVKEGMTLFDVIAELGLESKVMAAAVNMEIVKQDGWKEAVLKEGDAVELLDFVGGG